MKYDSDYTEAGADYYQQRDEPNREHLIRHHQRALAGSAAKLPWFRLTTAVRRLMPMPTAHHPAL